MFFAYYESKQMCNKNGADLLLLFLGTFISGHRQFLIGWPYPAAVQPVLVWTWPRGYKTFFMLSSAETKIYPAHKC